MAVKWLQKLHSTVPHLAGIAEKLNLDDGFKMYERRQKKSSDTTSE